VISVNSSSSSTSSSSSSYVLSPRVAVDPPKVEDADPSSDEEEWLDTSWSWGVVDGNAIMAQKGSLVGTGVRGVSGDGGGEAARFDATTEGPIGGGADASIVLIVVAMRSVDRRRGDARNCIRLACQRLLHVHIILRLSGSPLMV
jgi:hypothetical protein